MGFINPKLYLAFTNDTNMSQKELDELQNQEFWIQDQQGAIDLGIQQGREEGIQQGKAALIVRQLTRLEQNLVNSTDDI